MKERYDREMEDKMYPKNVHTVAFSFHQDPRRMEEVKWIGYDIYVRQMEMVEEITRWPKQLSPKCGEKKEEGNYA